MSKTKKLSNEVKNYILERKRKNPQISCRTLASETSSKFALKISKSSINLLLKSSRLSSPIGRRVSKVFRPVGEISGAGYAFLLGANYVLGLSKIMANSIKKAYPLTQLKLDTLETISEAWIMAKAIYNISLEKIENYDKSELWFITGRKANKGLLRQYVNIIKSLQPINYHIVSELNHILQDVHYLKISLADSSQYFLDGQLKSIWRDTNIPIDFSVTIDRIDSYIKSTFFGNDPVIILSAKPDTMLGEELSEFIFSLDGSSSLQRIRKIELISPKGEVVKETPFLLPSRRRFIVGIWPWQYKVISELEKRKAQGMVFLEPSASEIHFVEDEAKFTQHTQNITLTLRLIALKNIKEGPVMLGILTNLDPDEWNTKRVVENYVKQCPYFEAEHKLFLKITKKPSYFEEFITSEKILEEVKKLNESSEPDDFFSVLVDVLNVFAQRLFFPSDCSGWSLLKMRELFYKQRGFIKRDMAEDILFNILKSNGLQENELLNFAATRFNEQSIMDFSGRKLWILTPP